MQYSVHTTGTEKIIFERFSLRPFQKCTSLYKKSGKWATPNHLQSKIGVDIIVESRSVGKSMTAKGEESMGKHSAHKAI
jgi:hypothetical protein